MVVRLLEHADRPLRFAIRLADIVGQRPSDVRRAKEPDVREGLLHLRQGKTQMKLRIEVGIPKNDFQFRDFRAEVATSTDDTADTKAAQAILGHTSEEMTNHYIRHKVGRKVKPIR